MDLGVGVDLGGTHARAAVVSRSTGEIVAVHKETLSDRSPPAVVELIARSVTEVVRKARVDAASLGSIGVGVPGQCLLPDGIVLNAPNLGWRDVPVGELLMAALRARVRIVHDLTAAAWGESTFGAARGVKDAALVFVGSGIGSGLILDGRPYDGACGLAGELGHIKVRTGRDGKPPRRCACGELGCLEAYAGGASLIARVREDLSGGAASRVKDLCEGDLSRVHPGIVDAASEQGDAYARRLWDEVSELLGVAIANLATLLNPARVILGGGVLIGSPALVKRTRAVLDDAVSRSAGKALTVEPARLGDDAGIVGAALLPPIDRA